MVWNSPTSSKGNGGARAVRRSARAPLGSEVLHALCGSRRDLSLRRQALRVTEQADGLRVVAQAA